MVLVRFPFTDLSGAKQRPALVLSSDAFNSSRADVLVAAVTSQVPTALAPDEFLIATDDLAPCGLPKPSIVKLSKLVSLHQQLLLKRIGTMPPTTLAQVLAQLRRLF